MSGDPLGPLAQSMARQKRELEALPENQGRVAATTDGRTVTGAASVQKTWRNGFGVGAYVKGLFGQGRKSEYEVGTETKWRF